MGKPKKNAISPTRVENFPEWYQEVIKAAELAQNSAVRGCMVIKPWGFRLWEKIQEEMNRLFRKKGVENAYFPLFIPLSYFQKEANHVEGFATECAVVTHHRLEKDAEGMLQPCSPLEEPYVVRPTSEMIIGESFSKWIESYRDLPLKINQWANVVRWEMRPRIFLRTAEFLWQEGHTAHAEEQEALETAREMLELYRNFAQEYLALPLIAGEKTEGERFPGAEITFTIEGMMQDGKALQAGTSHFLGQHFSKAANICFRDQDGEEKLAWTTSWGVTTRLIGAMIMTHGDDDGMVLPPRIASSQVAILPLIHKEEDRESIETFCKKVHEKLSSCDYHGNPLEVTVDTRDMRGGEKSWSWIKKGVPLRIEIGKREVEENKLFIKQRTKGPKEAVSLPIEGCERPILEMLDAMQQEIFQRALEKRNQMIVSLETKEEIDEFFKDPKGAALVHYAGDLETEKQLQADYSASVRCIPFDMGKEKGTCPFTGKESNQRVLIARAY